MSKVIFKNKVFIILIIIILIISTYILINVKDINHINSSNNGVSSSIENIISPSTNTFKRFNKEFGPYTKYFDDETKVFTAEYPSADNESIMMNLYVDGIWATEPFNPIDLANQIKASGMKIISSFTTLNNDSGLYEYYFSATQFGLENNETNAYYIKVGDMDGGIYSLILSKKFNGVNSVGEDESKLWLSSNTDKAESISKLHPDDKWISIVEKEVSNR